MKIIITESQNMDIFVRRRLNDMVKMFNNRMTAYPPCDYNYDDGVNDYYSDVESTVVDSMVSKEGLSRDEDFDKINILHNTVSNLLYPIAFPILKSYYDDIIEAGCEDY